MKEYVAFAILILFISQFHPLVLQGYQHRILLVLTLFPETIICVWLFTNHWQDWKTPKFLNHSKHADKQHTASTTIFEGQEIPYVTTESMSSKGLTPQAARPH